MMYAGGRDDVDEDDESEVDEDEAAVDDDDVDVEILGDINGEDIGRCSCSLCVMSLLLLLSWIDIHDDVDGAKASTEKVVAV